MRTPSLKQKILTAAAAAGLTVGILSTALAEDVTLKVAYSSDYVPLSPPAGKAWWNAIIQDFEAANPGVKIEQIAIPGVYSDVENKLSLLFRSSSTAPDMAQLSNQSMAPWIASGYLAPLDDVLASADWYADIPDAIKAENVSDGKTYGVSHGENVMGLLYDKTIFAKAGLPTEWQPQSWNEILDVARKLKAADPNVWPLWIQTGSAQGATGAEYGPNNLLLGSSDPTIFNEETGKWVVDSKGIREVIGIYRTASKEGLLAPSSQLLNANAIATPPQEFPNHRIGIALAGNWFTTQWTKLISAPYYEKQAEELAFAQIPYIAGGKQPPVSTVGGWVMAMSSKTEHPDLVWKFIQTIMTKKHLLGANTALGFVPPMSKYVEDPDFVNVSPFHTKYMSLIPFAKGIPVRAEYPVWAAGFLSATEQVVLDPTLSDEAAVGIMSDYVGNQLGPDLVEVRE